LCFPRLVACASFVATPKVHDTVCRRAVQVVLHEPPRDYLWIVLSCNRCEGSPALPLLIYSGIVHFLTFWFFFFILIFPSQDFRVWIRKNFFPSSLLALWTQAQKEERFQALLCWCGRRVLVLLSKRYLESWVRTPLRLASEVRPALCSYPEYLM